MNLIAVLIDEDGNNMSAYGPFPSYDAIYKWNEEFLRDSGIDYWRYEIIKLAGVTEDKG
jgi:hypothetical protein